MLIARHHHHFGHLDCDGLDIHNHIYDGYLDRHMTMTLILVGYPTRVGSSISTKSKGASKKEKKKKASQPRGQVSVACRARHLFNPQPTNFAPLENYHHQFHRLHHHHPHDHHHNT